MKNKLLVFSSLILFLTGCKYPVYQISNTTETRIFITDSLDSDPEIHRFIQPYKAEMEELLNRELAYAPVALSLDGMNTTLGNFVTDLMKFEGNKIYEKLKGEKIDVVLMNRGGLRRTFAQGQLSVRSMYELMPFENEAVVVVMKGEKLLEMVNFLRYSSKNHPVSGLEFNKNTTDADFLINGEKFSLERNYSVLTNDYLQKGGDQMTFFKDPVEVIMLNVKLRDMFIEHLENTDTIKVNMKSRYLE